MSYIHCIYTLHHMLFSEEAIAVYCCRRALNRSLPCTYMASYMHEF